MDISFASIFNCIYKHASGDNNIRVRREQLHVLAGFDAEVAGFILVCKGTS